MTFEADDGSTAELTQTFDKPGLAIDFNIQKTRTKASNTAIIGIMNPSKDTMGVFQKDGVVRFDAGYKGDIASILVGNKQSANYQDMGGDKRFEILALEGVTAYENIQFSKQYGKGTSNVEIITDLAKFIADNNPAVDSVNFFTILPSDFKVYGQEGVVFGNANELLGNLLSPIGFQHFVNKGVLTILGQNGFVKDLEVILNPNNGLIGSPKPISNASNAKVSRPGIECRSILNYNFDVGRRLRLQTKEYNNKAFIIDSVNFVGSTYEGEYTADIKAYEADGVI